MANPLKKSISNTRGLLFNCPLFGNDAVTAISILAILDFLP